MVWLKHLWDNVLLLYFPFFLFILFFIKFYSAFTTANDSLKSIKHAYQSVGRPFPNTEIKIIDPQTNKTVDIGVDGELCARGPNIISGYYNDPEKTANTIDKHG